LGIIDDLIESLRDDEPVDEVRIGAHLTAVCSRHWGLASTLLRGTHDREAGHIERAGKLTQQTALELASLARSSISLEASIGLAAMNSLLDVDDSRLVDLNAGDLLIERSGGKKVALIGHFPFVPQLRKAAGQLAVIELSPQPGDIHADEGDVFVEEADIVAITGSALINHTLERILRLCRLDSFVMVLGPTTPLSPILFDHGVDVLSGTLVVDQEAALRCVGEGAAFRQMQGVRLVTMKRD
jgi:uncharacterized protein (DUF4213/DUF364 family)